ncbi:hypothetical protein CH330_07785 [candidate division WOR-3 bacterium JGI_Cruoil_03_51_56]|uniref:Uncharacterized protein n=1 Tax=candidate division WOR-3 bacterium JGI_Cruoil_03_51_56 TaxID=1973747 RepID=A0A235BRV3_UNCW3|nr:MAG: hypothetical protein CH330_07785 [candidate division WOR-3 bacterium JGI_Cruoil_03_51_56]
MNFKNHYVLFFWGVVLVFMLSGCKDYKSEINALNQRIAQLEQENAKLKEEIKKLRETDQNYFNTAVELSNEGRYKESIEKFKEMKSKFPSSHLVGEANKKIKEAQNRIKEIYRKEKEELHALLVSIKKQDIEISINKLEIYINESHPADLIQEAKKKLDYYKKKYEIIKVERESEKITGIRIVSVNSEWDWSGLLGDRLLCPKLKIKFKNISDKDIDRLEVKVTFINTSNKEIFGDALTYVIGYGDAPLRPRYSKTAYLTSSVGYKSDMVALNFPNLVAEVYINDKFYKKVRISKKYRGIDWGKK